MAEEKIYKIDTPTRVTGAASFVALAVALVLLLAYSSYPRPWVAQIFLVVFLVISVIANIFNFGDRVVFLDEKLVVQNIFLTRLGWRRAKEIPFADIAQVIEHKKNTFFLITRKGKRQTLDHFHPYKEFKKELQSKVAGF